MIKIGTQLAETAEQLEREKGIPRVVVFESIKEAMAAAYRRTEKLEEEEFEDGFEVRLLEKTGEIGIFKQKKIVETVSDTETEISLHDALEIDAMASKGDTIAVDVTPEDFGRIAAQSAKQVMMQRIREAEKRLIYNEFEERRGIVTPGIVQRIEGRNVIVSIGRIEAIMPPREQMPGEYYRVGSKIRVYVADLRDNGRVPQIIVSQAHAEMVREVFELEIPEIEDGIVEIKSISREAGHRTKVAVHSTSGDVDPQGACIGQRGSRIQAIVNELKNEKIDIIRWSENPVDFIINALAPAKILSVDILSDEPGNLVARVVVPDDQLSLAIGRDGQNVRLAARLTGWKLDIKSVLQMQAIERGEDPNALRQQSRPQQSMTPKAQEEEGEKLDIAELDELLQVDEEAETAEASVAETELPEAVADAYEEAHEEAESAQEHAVEDAFEAEEEPATAE
jgi:transcription termination/antitermination protein NusA